MERRRSRDIFRDRKDADPNEKEALRSSFLVGFLISFMLMLLEEPPKARKFLLELSIVASESQASFKAIISPDFICRNDFSCHDYNSSLGFNSIPEQHELDKLANHGIPGAQHHKEHSTNAQLSSMASLMLLANNSHCSY